MIDRIADDFERAFARLIDEEITMPENWQTTDDIDKVREEVLRLQGELAAVAAIADRALGQGYAFFAALVDIRARAARSLPDLDLDAADAAFDTSSPAAPPVSPSSGDAPPLVTGEARPGEGPSYTPPCAHCGQPAEPGDRLCRQCRDDLRGAS